MTLCNKKTIIFFLVSHFRRIKVCDQVIYQSFFQNFSEKQQQTSKSLLFTFAFFLQVFHNCSCVVNLPPVDGSSSVSLGQCPHSPTCSRSLTSYMVLFCISSFIKSLGMAPVFMIMIRLVKNTKKKKKILLEGSNFVFCNIQIAVSYSIKPYQVG